MRKGQTKRVWTKEQKLEIAHKHLDEHISIKKLGKEYGIIHGIVSRWAKSIWQEEKQHLTLSLVPGINMQHCMEVRIYLNWNG